VSPPDSNIFRLSFHLFWKLSVLTDPKAQGGFQFRYLGEGEKGNLFPVVGALSMILSGWVCFLVVPVTYCAESRRTNWQSNQYRIEPSETKLFQARAEKVRTFSFSAFVGSLICGIPDKNERKSCAHWNCKPRLCL